MYRPDILIGIAHHRAALGAIRSLGRAGYRVTAAFADKPLLSRAETFRSRYINEIVRCPNPEGHFYDFQAWLRDRLGRHPDELFLPCNESAVAAGAAVRRLMGETRRFVLPSDEDLTFTLSKVRATQRASSLGLAVPRSLYLRNKDGESLPRRVEGLEFPLVVKWDNYIDEQGVYHKGGNCIAYDPDMLADILVELEPSPCLVMLQEFVPGKGVGSFFLRHGGQTLLRFAHRRLHEVPWTGGVSSLSESSNDPGVLESGERLLTGIGYEGVAMVEFRQQPGERPFFLEINGRLWGSLGLALRAGADFPLAMVEAHVSGTTSVSQPDLSRTIRCRNLPLELEHIRSVFRSHRSGDRHAPSRMGTVGSLALRTFDPWNRSDLLWADDPSPALSALRRQVMDAGHRLRACLKNIRPRWHSQELTRRLLRNSCRIPNFVDDVQKNGILFLCYGNICRSPYALARWNRLQTNKPSRCPASSAGFHPRTDRPTPARFQAAAMHRGIDLTEHRSRIATLGMLETAGLIVVMDLANAISVENVAPQAIRKTVLLRAVENAGHPEISDPYGQPLPAGAAVYAQIDQALATLHAQLADGANAK